LCYTPLLSLSFSTTALSTGYFNDSSSISRITFPSSSATSSFVASIS